MHENNFYKYEEVLFKQRPGDDKSWIKMDPNDFDLLVLPEKEDEQPGNKNEKKKNEMGSLLAPKQYLAELQKRNQCYSQFKRKIGQSKLSN